MGVDEMRFHSHSLLFRVLNKWNARSNRSSTWMVRERYPFPEVVVDGCVGGQVDIILYGYDERTLNFNPGFRKSGGIGH